MTALAVAVLAGGLSLEREVSLRSGRRVAEALESRGHTVRRIDVDDQLAATLMGGAFDVAYLALHGKAGEDGTIQSLLEVMKVPYTGPDSAASALAWNKVVMKGLWRRAGLRSPDWVALSADAVRDMGAARVLDRVVAQLGLPLVVKPSEGGAAMGVRLVERADQLAPALIAAFSYHGTVLIEQFIAGTEVAVSIVGDRVLPPVEIHPKAGSYDFSARYTAGATEFHAPARLRRDVLAHAIDVAQQAYAIAGCRHVSRADMIVRPDGAAELLELDTCPGMTETSLLPLAARADGWDFADMCDFIVALAADEA